MAIQGLDAFLSDMGSAIDSDLLNKIKTYHIAAASFFLFFDSTFDFWFFDSIFLFLGVRIERLLILLSSLQNRLYILFYIFTPFR